MLPLTRMSTVHVCAYDTLLSCLVYELVFKIIRGIAKLFG